MPSHHKASIETKDGWVNYTRGYVYPEPIEETHLGAYTYFVVHGLSFESNLVCLGKDEFKERGAKYFLTAREDMREFENFQKNGKGRRYDYELLDSWAEHAKINTKRVIIRGFTYTDIGHRVIHVLTEDVLDLIPILMERQKRKPESYMKKLAELEQKWKVEDANLTRSVKLEEFKKTMNKFKVDKSQVLIAPCLQDYISTLTALYKGTAPITTYNSNGNLVTTAHQALFHIFQSVAHGYGWHELRKTSTKRSKLNEFYKFFVQTTKKYYDMEHGLLIATSVVEQDIEMLQNHWIFTRGWVKEVSLFPYNTTKYYEYIPFKHLREDCKSIGVGAIENSCDPKRVPICAARANILFGFIDIFYRKDAVEQKMGLLDGILAVMHFKHRKHHRMVLRKAVYETAGKAVPIVEENSEMQSGGDDSFSSIDSSDEEDEKEEQESDPKQTLDDLDGVSDGASEQSPNSRAQSIGEDNSSTTSENTDVTEEPNFQCCHEQSWGKPLLEVPKGFNPWKAAAEGQWFKISRTWTGALLLAPSDLPEPETIVVSHPALNDRCSHCFENIGKLKNTEKELRLAQNQAKFNEKQAMKTEELEKEMAVLKTKRENADKARMKAKEVSDEAVKTATKYEKKAMITDELEKKLKAKNAKLEENRKEIEKLKRTIASQSDLVEKNQMLEKRLLEQEEVAKQLKKSNKELKSKNARLEKELKSQNEQIEQDKEHFSMEYEKMEDKVVGIRKVNDELATQKLTQKEEIAQLKADIVLKQAEVVEKQGRLAEMSDINSRLQNEKVQLYQRIRDLERQLQRSQGFGGPGFQ